MECTFSASIHMQAIAGVNVCMFKFPSKWFNIIGRLRHRCYRTVTCLSYTRNIVFAYGRAVQHPNMAAYVALLEYCDCVRTKNILLDG